MKVGYPRDLGFQGFRCVAHNILPLTLSSIPGEALFFFHSRAQKKAQTFKNEPFICIHMYVCMYIYIYVLFEVPYYGPLFSEPLAL